MNRLSRRAFLETSGIAGGTALFAPLVSAQPPVETGPDYLLFVGVYTGKGSRGIYAWRFNSDTGRLTELGLAAETENPSFLAFHPKAWFLYAVNENSSFNGKPGGAVSAFTVNSATGKLSLINQVASRGEAPCHVMLDHTGQTAWVSNYTGGSVNVFPVADGGLGESIYFEQFHGSGPNKARQEKPHIHSTTISRDNKWAAVSDLGLDRIHIYGIGVPGAVKPATPAYVSAPPGSGPRHSTFSHSGRFLYGVNELASSVSAYSFDSARGALKLLHTESMLPAGYKGESTGAEIKIDAHDKFLYASNRGHDSIAIFSLKTAERPHLIGHAPSGGKIPRNFNLDPSGKWLLVANQESDNIVVYPRDPETGLLKAATQEVYTSQPVCLRFLRS